jgi:hypothetical protein
MVDLIAKTVFERLLKNDKINEIVYKYRNETYKNPIICKKCLKENRYDYYDFCYHIYTRLREIEREYFIKLAGELTNLPKDKIEQIAKTIPDYSDLYVIKQLIYRFRPEMALLEDNMYISIDSFTSHDRGGEGDNQLLIILAGVLLNSIFQNALYDIGKLGLKKGLEKIRCIIRRHRAEKETYKKIRTDFHFFFEKKISADRHLYLADSILSALKPREKKRLIKKIAKRKAKEFEKYLINKLSGM